MGRFINLYLRQIHMVRWRTGLQAQCVKMAWAHLDVEGVDALLSNERLRQAPTCLCCSTFTKHIKTHNILHMSLAEGLT